MPNTGTRPSTPRTASMTGATAAGSPGPLETKTPSGPRSRISAEVVPAGTTSRRQPAATSPRAMLSFIPQSTATTRGPSSPSARARPAASRGQVAPVEHRVLAHPRQQLVGAELVGDPAAHGAAVAQVAHQAAGVAVVDGHHPAIAEPRAPAGRPGGAGAVAGAGHDHRARPGPAALVAARPGPVVADHRRGEAEDLPEVRRVGDRLLVAGHAGGEDHLAQGRARGRGRARLEDEAVLQDHPGAAHLTRREICLELVRAGLLEHLEQGHLGAGGARAGRGHLRHAQVAVARRARRDRVGGHLHLEAVLPAGRGPSG